MYKDSQPKNDWGVIKTDDFKTNPKSNRRFTAIDDFYENPLELRALNGKRIPSSFTLPLIWYDILLL